MTWVILCYAAVGYWHFVTLHHRLGQRWYNRNAGLALTVVVDPGSRVRMAVTKGMKWNLSTGQSSTGLSAIYAILQPA